jgi:hypothetical protein
VQIRGFDLMKQTEFMFTGWGKLTEEQKDEFMKLLETNIKNMRTIAIEVLRKGLDEGITHRVLGKFGNKAFCFLAENKPHSILVTTLNPQRNEMTLMFAVSPLNKAKKEFVRQHGCTPMIQLVEQALNFGVRYRYTNVRYSQELSREAQLVAQKRIKRKITKKEMQRRAKRIRQREITKKIGQKHCVLRR